MKDTSERMSGKAHCTAGKLQTQNQALFRLCHPCSDTVPGFYFNNFIKDLIACAQHCIKIPPTPTPTPEVAIKLFSSPVSQEGKLSPRIFTCPTPRSRCIRIGALSWPFDPSLQLKVTPAASVGVLQFLAPVVDQHKGRMGHPMTSP